MYKYSALQQHGGYSWKFLSLYVDRQVHPPTVVLSGLEPEHDAKDVDQKKSKIDTIQTKQHEDETGYHISFYTIINVLFESFSPQKQKYGDSSFLNLFPTIY